MPQLARSMVAEQQAALTGAPTHRWAAGHAANPQQPEPAVEEMVKALIHFYSSQSILDHY